MMRCVLLFSMLAVTALAQSAIEVFPSAIKLGGPRDRQSLVVRSTDATGVTHDRTGEANMTPENAAIVRIEGNRVVPLADGETMLVVRFGDAAQRVPIVVSGMATTRALEFRRDIMPVLSKAGCNGGSCHGTARGQDGFHLSLFGYDPDRDYEAITRELPGRRINFALPAESLLLTKATNAVPHTGGKRFDVSDSEYAALLEWLRGGSPRDPANAPRVTGIRVEPQDIVLETGSSQRLLVQATYSDGSERDITSLAVFISNNDGCAAASPAGVVTAGRRGEALVMARFDAYTVGTSVIVVPPDCAPVNIAADGGNFIDEKIAAKLRRLRFSPSGLCSDEEFLRRAYLDLIGLLPTPEEYAAYLADGAADRRARLIDALLGRKEFVEIWVMKWAERLQLRSTQQVSYKATLLYYEWLQQRIAANVPINQIVREIVASDGGTFASPAINFYQLEQDTLKLSENTVQAFLGTRIQCAQCHNHPFDRWTMDDYYGFAAFFAQVGRKPGEDPRETIVFNSGGGEMKHPVGGRAMAPKFLGGATADLAGRDRRAVLADWLTASDNRLFARNVANFVWAHFLGRGVVEPVDDVRVSNPPVNAALLDALADRLIASGYDLRALVRDICNSQAYQRSSRGESGDVDEERNFARAAVRRIRAETLLDCISRVTGRSEKFQGLPLGARAVEIADGSVGSYFLTTFGRAKRETVCTCEVVMEPSLSQALHLINGDTVHRKIHDGKVVPTWLAAGATPQQVIERLYVTTLCRKPTDDERSRLQAIVGENGDATAALEDLFWALLNSKEFIFNH